MRWSPVLLAALAGLETAHAHGNSPHPNIVLPRVRDKEELRQRRAAFGPWNPPTVANKPHNHARNHLNPRQASTTIPVGDNDQCGGTFGRCADGFCCSAEGWCGKGPDYCSAPDCQINYGPACDGNQKPKGTDTSKDTRTRRGSVPYGGVGIYSCEKDGDIAVTYDDGPYIYTAAMLDAFKAHGAVATFFITGNNLGKGMINVKYRDVIKRMVAEGHQVASHTWSHENLDQMTTTQRKNQMIWNEIALKDILGFYPTYMRPPYSICGTDCQKLMTDLGYHITYFDLDTEGYLHSDPSQIQVSVGLWDAAMNARSPCNASYLHIEHDIHEQVATTFTNHMLDSIVANGWRAVTVGECLGDPPANWYRGNVPAYNFKISAVSPKACTSTSPATSKTTTNTASIPISATSTSTALPISRDATCGATAGKTCQGSTFGNCCSVNGWCGSTSAYCGTGCQSKYGTCTSQSSSNQANIGRTSSPSSSPSGSSTSSSSVSGTTSTGVRSSTLGRTSSSSSASSRNSVSAQSNGSTSRSSSPTRSLSSDTRSSGTSSPPSAAASSGPNAPSASTSAAPPSSTLPVSKDGTCGATKGQQCFGSTFGSCCSQYGWCGSSTAHCGDGCQSAYGTCTSGSGPSSSGASSSSSVTSSGAVSASSSSPTAAANTKISTTGQCGGTDALSCLGSGFGDCCSPYNYCGSSTDHCGTGCQSSFGKCTSASGDTKVSLNGACGASAGNTTCTGSAFGKCCSQYGYCGSTAEFCGAGCQSGFGTCCKYPFEGTVVRRTAYFSCL
ncbi:glycoside hydrolase/deacetylase [Colletotrichum eremochloae]|nr:glycoside hydrolase/deacetylase [Colletotrichum eremochloae]